MLDRLSRRFEAMKKVLLAVAAMSCVGTAAMAGANAGGMLVSALSVGTVYTVDVASYCGTVTATDCDNIVNTVSGPDPAVINVLAVFPGNGDLAGVTFGVSYTTGVSLLAWGPCGQFELADGTWPASGSGTAVTFLPPCTAHMCEVYWFVGYSYYSDCDALTLIGHPTQGGNFGDSSTPSVIDPIADYGVFGFDCPGHTPCPNPEDQPGACCLPDESCVILFATECADQGGTFMGEGVPCIPDPCFHAPTGACCIDGLCFTLRESECLGAGGEYKGDGVPCDDTICLPTPTVESSWGAIKNNYR
jgi:hypothetical protein